MAANKKAWKDFSTIIGDIIQANNDIKKLGENLKRLKEMKVEVLDDSERKAELKKILDQHFDDTMNTTTKLKNACAKLDALYLWLENNNYLQYDDLNGGDV